MSLVNKQIIFKKKKQIACIVTHNVEKINYE